MKLSDRSYGEEWRRPRIEWDGFRALRRDRRDVGSGIWHPGARERERYDDGRGR